MPDYDLGTARGKIEIDSSGVESGVAKAQTAVGGLSGDADKAAGTFLKVGGVLGGVGLAAVAGFGVAVNAASDFEKGLSAINAVSGATPDQMEAVRKKALQLGADTKFSAGEASSAIEELVKAGISIPDVLNGAADSVVALAAAGEVDLPTAATIAANAMNQFHLAASDMPNVANLISGAANASAIDVGDFGMALSQAGASANLVGVSFDDLSVAIAAMGNAGIKGSDAGTSLKTFLSNLQPTTDKQTALMKQLGIVTEDGGNKFFDAAGHIKSMSEVAQVLQDSTKGLTDQQKTMALETIFGSDAIRAAAVIADNGAAGFDTLSASMGKVSAADVAAKRMDNLSGSLEQLKGSLETALIQAGTPAQAAIRKIVDALTGLVNVFAGLSPQMQTVIVVSALVVGALVGLAGAFIATVGAVMKLKKSIDEFQKAVKVLELAQKRQAIAQNIQSAATKVATGVQAAFNAVMEANPIFLVIAAIVAIGAALFVLYKKWQPFHDLVDATWQALQTFWDKVLDFAGGIKDAIGGIVDWVKRNWDLLTPLFLGPIGLIIIIVRRFGDDIVRFIGNAIDAVVDFFTKLPGRTVHFVADMIAAIIGFILKLPENAAFGLGLVLGTAIRWGFDLIKWVVQLGIDFIAAFINFMTELPGRVLGFLNTTWDNLYAFGVKAVNTAKTIGSDIISGIINFITDLPGQVLGFLNTTWDNLYAFGVNAVNKAKEIGGDVLNGILDFVKNLPGRVGGFLSDVVTTLGNWIGTLYDKSKDLGTNAFNGFIDFFKDLPGRVKEIIGDLVQKIKDAVGDVFGGAKNLGVSLWNGFKKGLFGSPHTKVEYAVWDMLDNVKKGTQDLAKHVGTIEGLRADLPSADYNMALGIGAGVLQPAGAGASGVVADQAGTAAPYIGEVNINNPVGETSDQSLTRTMQKLEYAGYFG